MCAWCPQRWEGGFGCPGTRVTDSLSQHIGSGTETQVLYQSSKCSNHWTISPAHAWTFLISCLTHLGFQTVTQDVTPLPLLVCLWQHLCPKLTWNSLCSPGWLPTCSKLIPKSWITGMSHYALLTLYLYKQIVSNICYSSQKLANSRAMGLFFHLAGDFHITYILYTQPSAFLPRHPDFYLKSIIARW